MKNTLATFTIKKTKYAIGATGHAIARINERDVNPRSILQAIINALKEKSTK